jgi:hypothetical protein
MRAIWGLHKLAEQGDITIDQPRDVLIQNEWYDYYRGLVRNSLD